MPGSACAAPASLVRFADKKSRQSDTLNDYAGGAEVLKPMTIK